jgi:hypothetical protein
MVFGLILTSPLSRLHHIHRSSLDLLTPHMLMICLLSGGAVAYRSKTQTVTATSSTEAEFLAAITAAKTAKYLLAILFGLGFTQSTPTPHLHR